MVVGSKGNGGKVLGGEVCGNATWGSKEAGEPSGNGMAGSNTKDCEEGGKALRAEGVYRAGLLEAVGYRP